MLKNPINFFIAVGFLFPQSFGLAVGFLQLLKPKSHINHTDLIKFFISKLGLQNI